MGKKYKARASVTRILKDYNSFLQSPKWLNFRKEALLCFNNECWFCKSKEGLQLHHTRYSKTTLTDIGSRVPYRRLRWFLLLCRDCHTAVHKLHKQSDLNVYKATMLYRDTYYPRIAKWLSRKKGKSNYEKNNKTATCEALNQEGILVIV